MKGFILWIFLAVLTVFMFTQCEIEKDELHHDIKQIAVETKEYMKKDDVLKIANSETDLKEVMSIEYDDKILERESNLIPIAEMFEDYPDRIEKYHRENQKMFLRAESLQEDVDLREWDTPVKEQWNGTCSAFGLTAVQELQTCKSLGVCNIDISERHRWSFYKKYSSMTALKTSHLLVADEKQWPQDQVNGPSTIQGKFKVDEWEYLGDNKDAVISELNKGNPIYMWSQTPNCMLKCKKVCAKNENTFADGGHAYSIVGYYQKDDPILIVKNSWGLDCGDNGYQSLPFKIWDNASYWEAAVLKKVSVVGVAPNDPNNPVDPIIPPKKVKKCEWRWKWTHFWEKRKYCWYE